MTKIKNNQNKIVVSVGELGTMYSGSDRYGFKVKKILDTYKSDNTTKEIETEFTDGTIRTFIQKRTGNGWHEKNDKKYRRKKLSFGTAIDFLDPCF